MTPNSLRQKGGFGLIELFVSLLAISVIFAGAYQFIAKLTGSTDHAMRDLDIRKRVMIVEKRIRDTILHAGANPKLVGFNTDDAISYNNGHYEDEFFAQNSGELAPIGINGAWRHGIRLASDLDGDGRLLRDVDSEEFRLLALRASDGILYLDQAPPPTLYATLNTRPQPLCTLIDGYTFSERFDLIEVHNVDPINEKILVIAPNVLCLEFAYFRDHDPEVPRPSEVHILGACPGIGCVEDAPFMTQSERDLFALLIPTTSDHGLPFLDDQDQPEEYDDITNNDLLSISRIRVAVVMEGDRPVKEVEGFVDPSTGRNYPVVREEWEITLDKGNRAVPARSLQLSLVQQ